MTGLIEAVVHAVTLAGDEVVLVELRSVGGTPLPPAEPGAHIDLHLPTPTGATVRQYSLVEAGRTDRYLVAVQHEVSGRGGSRYVHRTLRVGDRMTISEPRSTFPLVTAPHRALLLAGGIGVTPLVAMADDLATRGIAYDLLCFAAGPMPLAEVLAAKPWSDHVQTYDTTVSNPLRTGDLGIPITPETVVYACGPGGFLDAVTSYARAAGLPEDAVRTERFSLDEPVDVSGASFTVIAESTGERMSVGEDETIAEVLERHGYDVVLSCEQGICGSCLTPVVSGVPDHRDEVQSPAEHAANQQINVCVSRSCTPELVLGL